MVDNLRSSLGSVLIYQGAFTICILVLLPWLLDAFGIDSVHAPLFRVACVACVFHALLLVLMVVLLYFDFRQIVMWLSALFMTTNGIFTYLTLDNPELFGWGYMLSTLITLIASIFVLWNRLDNLEFVTFVQQPITQQKIVSR